MDIFSTIKSKLERTAKTFDEKNFAAQKPIMLRKSIPDMPIKPLTAILLSLFFLGKAQAQETTGMTPKLKSIKLSTGVSLQYVEQGDPLGVPVLLLHGLSDSWHSFELVLPHLPESIHIFALSQRGHGESSRPEEGYYYKDFAADAAAFMDVLDLDAVVVVGHSLGSSIAKRFAINYPDRTLGLVLVGSANNWPNNPAVQQLWEGVISKMEDPIDPGFVREFQMSTLATSVPKTFMETVVQESLKVPAQVWKATVTGILDRDLSKGIHKIKAPTLIIWGDQDELASRNDQEAQLEAIPKAQLKVYEGFGHGVHWEQPQRFASDLATFIEAAAN